MNKFGWSEVKEFWEARSSYWENADHEDDPDALRAVLTIGEPLWYGKRRARIEGIVYRALFDLVPLPRPGARALDIGCGAGRWARFISEHGYQTVGIDLQPALIQAARRRYPHIDFFHTSVQEYSSEEPFDLVSSVGVLQCNPFEEQFGVIRKIRESLVDGGYVIMLEGINQRAQPETFCRPIDSWIEVFEKSGFRNVGLRRYYYDWAFKRVDSAWKGVRHLASIPRRRGSSENKPVASPEERARTFDFERRDVRRSVARLLKGFDPAESILIRRNVALDSNNCGFLFQAI